MEQLETAINVHDNKITNCGQNEMKDLNAAYDVVAESCVTISNDVRVFL